MIKKQNVTLMLITSNIKRKQTISDSGKIIINMQKSNILMEGINKWILFFLKEI